MTLLLTVVIVFALAIIFAFWFENAMWYPKRKCLCGGTIQWKKAERLPGGGERFPSSACDRCGISYNELRWRERSAPPR